MTFLSVKCSSVYFYCLHKRKKEKKKTFKLVNRKRRKAFSRNKPDSAWITHNCFWSSVWMSPWGEESNTSTMLLLCVYSRWISSLCAGYGYATLANLIICLMAVFGIVVLLFSACTQVFELCIQFCISLAVGSLTGDALLHLLPAVSNALIQHNTHNCWLSASHCNHKMVILCYKAVVIVTNQLRRWL